jgi:short-subunit dehydrogenase
MSDVAVWRRALVTGASSGIGEAIVRRLAADGVAVVLVARRADLLRSVAESLEGEQAEVLAADLTDSAAVEVVASRLRDEQRPIDLLVNNAGVGAFGAFWSLGLERQLDQVACNVTALVHLTYSALERMVPASRGAVLNVSSLAGEQPGPGDAVYAASKAFVTNFSESLAEELRDSNVTVTAVCPGLTVSEFHTSAGVPHHSGPQRGPLWMTAEEVADRALDAAARGKPFVIPGVANRLLTAASKPVPRTLKRRLSRIGVERWRMVDAP